MWKPPFTGFVWNHHLHTEDEVFAYSILSDWQLPDCTLNGSIIFVASPVEQSGFLEELQEFWTKWVIVKSTVMVLSNTNCRRMIVQ